MQSHCVPSLLPFTLIFILTHKNVSHNEVVSIQSGQICPRNWTYFHDDNICVNIVGTIKYKWKDAVKSCRQRYGASLLSLNDLRTNTRPFLQSLMKEKINKLSLSSLFWISKEIQADPDRMDKCNAITSNFITILMRCEMRLGFRICRVKNADKCRVGISPSQLEVLAGWNVERKKRSKNKKRTINKTFYNNINYIIISNNSRRYNNGNNNITNNNNNNNNNINNNYNNNVKNNNENNIHNKNNNKNNNTNNKFVLRSRRNNIDNKIIDNKNNNHNRSTTSPNNIDNKNNISSSIFHRGIRNAINDRKCPDHSTCQTIRLVRKCDCEAGYTIESGRCIVVNDKENPIENNAAFNDTIITITDAETTIDIDDNTTIISTNNDTDNHRPLTEEEIYQQKQKARRKANEKKKEMSSFVMMSTALTVLPCILCLVVLNRCRNRFTERQVRRAAQDGDNAKPMSINRKSLKRESRKPDQFDPTEPVATEIAKFRLSLRKSDHSYPDEDMTVTSNNDTDGDTGSTL